MADHKVNVGAVTTNVHMGVNLEKTEVKARAEIVPCSPDEQQRIDDDKLIPNVGDQRQLTTDGRVYSPDGESSFPCRNVFTRTRNKNGGVDVLCMVHALTMSGANDS